MNVVDFWLPWQQPVLVRACVQILTSVWWDRACAAMAVASTPMDHIAVNAHPAILSTALALAVEVNPSVNRRNADVLWFLQKKVGAI